ncbi:hydroxyethylthiazole kinase [Cricetibacter osteomyelitidis]|uniref:Hydroxyethylthiazole kinase n=1 Tax=Cricetibacter osteomyelitidis TaxID=1521931 RepID=A0A4R2T1K0_9PAST|nr:hydroxyethylthiazole kinase [Cricetibacter osteomyelitidis]TCP95795.1 hydroxyethylthiazole kinase [Cricetibacter osteomyelitidis]
MELNYIQQIRRQNPLIHNITNYVVANYVANGLLALGASPIMSYAVQEMQEMPAFSKALVINIGTLTEPQVEGMIIAGKTANQQHIPVVLDPVGVGATNYRQQTVARLLQEIQFTAIRGNAGEIAYLAQADWQAKGVDSGQGNGDLAEIAKKVAQQYQCVVAISGETDYLSNGKQVATIHNGSPLFPKITGSGCLLSAVCGAFLAVAEKSQYFTALINACTSYAVAGELAAQTLQLTEHGQFYVKLLDQLAQLTDEQAQQYGEIRYV